MFGIFILTVASIVLIPYTISHFWAADDAAVAQPWAEKARGSGAVTDAGPNQNNVFIQGKKKKSKLHALLKKCLTKGKIIPVRIVFLPIQFGVDTSHPQGI
jgi:hypothetical protein